MKVESLPSESYLVSSTSVIFFFCFGVCLCLKIQQHVLVSDSVLE